MKDYLFYDEDTGEKFIVEAENKEVAYMRAYMFFKNPKFDAELTFWEAEVLGLDTY